MKIRDDNDRFQESRIKAARAYIQMFTQVKSKIKKQMKRSGIGLCQA
jgi:hypothetical protein